MKINRRELLKSSIVIPLLPILPLDTIKDEEEKIYYKVVNSHNKSARWWPRNLSRIHYKINEWITPDIGKIFIFDTLKNAIEFHYGFDNEKIYKCVVKNPTKAEYYLNNSNSSIEDFWKNYNKPTELAKINGVAEPPKGTIYCDAVKLLEEVTNG